LIAHVLHRCSESFNLLLLLCVHRLLLCDDCS
jgi:hypothetical protein